MQDGYAKPERVSFTTRSDMQESVAGFDAVRLEREWYYALSGSVFDDPDALRWIASLAVRRIEDLEYYCSRLAENDCDDTDRCRAYGCRYRSPSC